MINIPMKKATKAQRGLKSNLMKRVIPLTTVLFILFSFPICNANEQLTNLNSQYIVVMDYDSGRVLYQRNCDMVVPMASTTKIMTAIVALENSKLTDIVTVSKKASSTHGSTMGIKEGEKYTMEELLYGLLLESGNDCAVAIAEHISGSVERFARLMNSKAFNLGAFNTRFVTPHGLDADGHFTTALELATITQYAYKNDVFRKIVSTKSKEISSHRILNNTNQLLWSMESADGVKTGYTGKAGRCLVSSSTREGKRLICVLLNSSNRWQDSRRLMEYGFKKYNIYKSYKADDLYENISVKQGVKDKLSVKLKSDFTVPISEEEEKELSIKSLLPDSLNAPIYKGQEIGKLAFYKDGEIVYSVPYIASEDITIKKEETLTKKILKIFDQLF